MKLTPWQLPPVQEPEGNSHLPGFLREILAQRGLEGEAARQFLEDTLPLSDPMTLRDMAPAAERIHRAIQDRERILIFGDFDCDGITATVMLYDYLEHCGADVLYYIPERETEGYGLNKATMDRTKEAGVTLLITVDNGISALEEAAYAKELGLDLIVTDHHTPREQLPQGVAILNPHRSDCSYPNKDLCGAGVAFQLICALDGTPPELMLEQYGDLVVLATLADAVPVTGENRTLVKLGLEALADTQRPGLLALAKAAGLDLARRDTEVVTFGLAPRVNVAGRIGSVDLAVELLLCEDENRAEELAQEVHSLNHRRKEMEAEVSAEIQQMLEANPGLLHQRVLILAGQGWHRGIIGITAARMADRYDRPCMILSLEEGEVRGSARSVEGYDIIQAIHRCGHLLTRYGGHPMAAGLSLAEAQLPAFTQALLEDAAQRHPQMPVPVLAIDARLSPGEATLENIHKLQALAPFGTGTPQPVVAILDQPITSITPLGNGSHLRLGLGGTVETVLFGTGPAQFPFAVGERVDCALTLSINLYNGQERPSLRVAAVRPAGLDLEPMVGQQSAYEALRRGEAPEGDLSFTREDLSVVYRYLRQHSPFPYGPLVLSYRLGQDSSHFKVLSALDILCELGLIHRGNQGGSPVWKVPAVAEKSNLQDSATFQILQQRLVK